MIQFNYNTSVWHLSKKNTQYITTSAVKSQTFKNVYQTEEYKTLIIISTLYTS